MFAKLLKHEWKSTCSLLGVLSLAVLGLGVVGTVILRILMFCGEQIRQGNELLTVLVVMLSVSLVILCFALAIYVAAVQLSLLHRFYKHKFTDEGYLTFTLPADSIQLFLSAYVNHLLWSLISGAAVAAAVLMVCTFGSAKDGLVNVEFLVETWTSLRETVAALIELGTGSLLVWALVMGLVALFGTPAIAMTCITVGAVLAKKHKLLTAFGIYYAYSAAFGLVSSVLTVFATIFVIESAPDSVMAITYGVQALLQLGAAVGGGFLSVHLMKRKLNLP